MDYSDLALRLTLDNGFVVRDWEGIVYRVQHMSP